MIVYDCICLYMSVYVYGCIISIVMIILHHRGHNHFVHYLGQPKLLRAGTVTRLRFSLVKSLSQSLRSSWTLCSERSRTPFTWPLVHQHGEEVAAVTKAANLGWNITATNDLQNGPRPEACSKLSKPESIFAGWRILGFFDCDWSYPKSKEPVWATQSIVPKVVLSVYL